MIRSAGRYRSISSFRVHRPRTVGVLAAGTLPAVLWVLLPARLVLAQQKAEVSAPVRLERLHSVGCADCSGPELLSGVLDIEVREDGSVVLVDRDPPFLRVFGPQGSAVLQALGEGDGPGEARSATALAVLKGGRMVALDSRLRRLTVLDGQGQVTETLRPSEFPLDLHGAADGSGFWLIETDFRTGPRFSLWAEESLARTPVVPDLDGMGLVDAELPFQLFAAAAGPGGSLAIGAGDIAYRIRVLGRDGRRLHDAVRDVPRVSKTAEEIAEERAVRAAGRARLLGGSRGGTNPEAAALNSEIDVDPLKRHFNLNDLEVDSEGRLWVKTARGSERTAFDVFSPSGAYLGEVRAEGRVVRYSVGHGFLATVTRDALDIETVTVWRVR